MKHKIPKRMHYGGDGTESYRKSFTYRSLQHYIVQLETAAATTQRQFRVEGDLRAKPAPPGIVDLKFPQPLRRC